MLDQNTALIFSALIGGILTIAGGFIANYYIQTTTRNLSKRKEIRNILEQLYKDVNQIKDVHYAVVTRSIKEQTIYYFKAEELSDLLTYINKIDMLVNLYISPLREDFAKYSDKMEKVKLDLSQMSGGIQTYEAALRLIDEASQDFQRAIIRILKKEGYAYF